MKKIMILLMFLNVNFLLSQDSNNLKFLRKVNDLRISKGLDTLVYDESLFSLSKNWGKYIVNKLSRFSEDQLSNNHSNDPMFLHVNYNSRFDKILKRKDIQAVGENLVLIMDKDINVEWIDYAFNSWKNSSSHYELMVDSRNTNFALTSVHDTKKQRILYILIITENIK